MSRPFGVVIMLIVLGMTISTICDPRRLSLREGSDASMVRGGSSRLFNVEALLVHILSHG